LIVHVDLDSFFVAVERIRHPDLAGTPVIIGGRPGSHGVVAAASREARRCGVRAGMPLVQASMRCPAGVFLDGAFDAYFAASLQIDVILRRESQDIEWLSIDEVVIALPPSGRPARHQAAIEPLERIQQSVRALGFDAACGVARSKLVARVAAKLARPRGVVHVLDGYEARFLSPLKIEMLPAITTGQARRLRQAGIRRLGQVARLSEAQLCSLAGRAAAPLARHAAGVDVSRIRRTALPPARLEDHELDTPTADICEIQAALQIEVDRAGQQLRARGVLARTVTVRIRFADGRVDSRTATLTGPSAIDGALLAAAVDLIPRLCRPERLVRAISVSCAGLLASTGEPALFPIRARQG
jgi:DNA polymerase-4